MKKPAPEKSETETAVTEASPAGSPVVTQRPVALPAVGAGVDALLTADIEQDIAEEGGYGRRTTIAVQLLRTDRRRFRPRATAISPRSTTPTRTRS